MKKSNKEKCLYTIKTIINFNDYLEMAKTFSYKKKLIKFILFFATLLLILFIPNLKNYNSAKDIIICFIFFIFILVFSIILFNIVLNSKLRDNYNKIIKYNNEESNEIQLIYELFTDYMLMKSNNSTSKFYYKDLEIEEIDKKIYLNNKITRTVSVIKREDVDLKILDFIKSKVTKEQ